MNLDRAKSLADRVKSRLAPHCERIEIAGSIRRLRDWVNDIDLVILPKPGERETIQAQIRSGCGVEVEGEQNCIYRMPLPSGGLEWIQLDIFFARPAQQDLLGYTPGNFGTLLVCRTGSKEHNIYLVEHAKRQGLVWRPYAGVFAGDRCLAGESENEVFTALGLEWIAPVDRER
jgi:DNA polymerase (family 10)